MKENFIGVGLRPTHFPYLKKRPQTHIDWFEVITENIMNSFGRPYEMVKMIREDYPIALHGVSLSIASHEQVNLKYLENLKRLCQEFDPIRVTDHLCWTGLKEHNFHNLLPFPYTDETLDHIAKKVDTVQTKLKRQIGLENLSAYFSLKNSKYSEHHFIKKLIEKTGCQILLDINNIYVNSVNQDFNPKEYLDTFQKEDIAQIHLAGHSDFGDYLFDTHSGEVCEDVWDLFKYKKSDLKEVPILIEWDQDIPEFPKVEQEAIKAREILK